MVSMFALPNENQKSDPKAGLINLRKDQKASVPIEEPISNACESLYREAFLFFMQTKMSLRALR